MKAAERVREPDHAGDYSPGPAVVPHRKNAAEWVMWAALWPVAWVVAKLTTGEAGDMAKLRCRRDDENARARGT